MVAAVINNCTYDNYPSVIHASKTGAFSHEQIDKTSILMSGCYKCVDVAAYTNWTEDESIRDVWVRINDAIAKGSLKIYECYSPLI